VKVDRDSVYTLDELSALLDVSVRTLQRLIADGGLPARRIGRKPVVIGGDLLDRLPPAVEGGIPEHKPETSALGRLLGGRGS
jgi:DNA binding domain, excisionase family